MTRHLYWDRKTNAERIANLRRIFKEKPVSRFALERACDDARNRLNQALPHQREIRKKFLMMCEYQLRSDGYVH